MAATSRLLTETASSRSATAGAPLELLLELELLELLLVLELLLELLELLAELLLDEPLELELLDPDPFVPPHAVTNKVAMINIIERFMEGSSWSYRRIYWGFKYAEF